MGWEAHPTWQAVRKSWRTLERGLDGVKPLARVGASECVFPYMALGACVGSPLNQGLDEEATARSNILLYVYDGNNASEIQCSRAVHNLDPSTWQPCFQAGIRQNQRKFSQGSGQSRKKNVDLSMWQEQA